jgi:hypothetical protein
MICKMDFRVLFLGFDDAGKTALLYKMKGRTFRSIGAFQLLDLTWSP